MFPSIRITGILPVFLFSSFFQPLPSPATPVSGRRSKVDWFITPMKSIIALLIPPVMLLQIQLQAQPTPAPTPTPTPTKSSIPYVDNADERQVLDIYAPPNAKDLPVVFWIHGGGWQAGDKSDVKRKPQGCVGRGFVFVSIDYRLWANGDMATLHGDVAKSCGWVHRHRAEY